MPTRRRSLCIQSSIPKRQPSYASYKSESLLVVTEYDMMSLRYLMVPPIDLKKLSAFLGDPLI